MRPLGFKRCRRDHWLERYSERCLSRPREKRFAAREEWDDRSEREMEVELALQMYEERGDQDREPFVEREPGFVNHPRIPSPSPAKEES